MRAKREAKAAAENGEADKENDGESQDILGENEDADVIF